MRKNKNLKKLIILILVLAAAFAIFLFVYTRKQEYNIEYDINDYHVKEEFILEADHYHLTISNDSNTYETYLNINYSPKRRLITSIENIEKDDLSCIKLNDNIINHPICKKDNNYVSYYINDQIEYTTKDTFNRINIYDLLNNSYLVWNYNGFNYLYKDKLNSIKLFENDTYVPQIIAKVNQYLFIANYDEKYEFSSYFVINFKKGTYKEYEIKTPISMDSYILGTYKDSIYLVDEKEQQEYEINVVKGKVYKTSGKLLINGVWEKTDVDKIIKSKLKFREDEFIFFNLENNTLYYNEKDIKTKVTNLKVDYLIEYNEYEAYFIAEGKTYYFNINEGIKAILGYTEWNFNYTNSVFIYDNQK